LRSGIRTDATTQAIDDDIDLLTGCHYRCRSSDGIGFLIASVKNLLEKERDLSPSLKAALEMLLVLVALLLNRRGPGGRRRNQEPGCVFIG
jgi:hypothetical protein